MSALELVNRLDFCKSAGKDKWIARCPAHADKSPSLSIKESTNGNVIIHCFAGCGALDVLNAVGLDWDALFPQELEHVSRRRYSAPTETVDSLVIEIAQHDRAMGKRLSKADTERLRAAMKRQPKQSDAVIETAYESGAISLEDK